MLVLIPHAVEPDRPDRAVLREQLRELGLHEVEVGVGILPLGRASRTEARAAARGILAPPVDERVVEVHAQPLPVALFGQLAHDVAGEGRGLDDVVGRLRRAEHREAVVVARREADVARSGLAEGRDPRRGVEGGGVEGPGELLVFAVVDVEIGHHPLALTHQGVEPPVDEDAEAVVGEPGAGGEVLGSGHIARLCRSRHCEECGAAEQDEFFHGLFGMFPQR